MKGTITVMGQPVLLPMIKQFTPQLLAQSIIGVQPMTSDVGGIFALKAPKPKYKFSRAKWYVAEYNWVNQVEVVEWCTEQFGPHPENPDAWSRWNHKWQDRIQFRDEREYNWFILRWSS